MVTKIDICNLSLAQLGQSPISSLEQDNEKARRLKLFYVPVRDEVLRTHNWAFAGVCEPLALLDNNPDEQGRFIYQYPGDALFVRNVFDQAHAKLPFQEFSAQIGTCGCWPCPPGRPRPNIPAVLPTKIYLTRPL